MAVRNSPAHAPPPCGGDVVQGTFDLFSAGCPRADDTFRTARRHELSERSWIEHQAGWLGGSGDLFDALLTAIPWRQHRRPMFDRMVDEPRLTAWYPAGVAWPHAVLGELSALLSERYGQELCNLGVNLYRSGADSVAWHGDRVAKAQPEPVVAIVSLGTPRPFLLRPKGGGTRCRTFSLGWGDLLVMGGRCQQEFDHAVPKLAQAQPRLSVMFRPLDERWERRTGGVSRPASAFVEEGADQLEPLLDGGDATIELGLEALVEERLELRSG